MPQVTVPVTVDDDPVSSATQYKRGLLEMVDIEYLDSITSVVISIEELVDEANETWRTRWSSPSSNTDAFYLPVKLTTLDDGTEGTGEAHIPLRSPWRVTVTGASSGAVNVYVSLDQ